MAQQPDREVIGVGGGVGVQLDKAGISDFAILATGFDMAQDPESRRERPAAGQDGFMRPRASNSLMRRPSRAASNTYCVDRSGYFSYPRPTTSYQASKSFSLDDSRDASLRKP